MKTATLGQLRKILELMGEVSQEQVQVVLESGLFSDLLMANVAQVNREAFRKLCGLPPILPTFQVTVDYGKSLAEMIAAGNYDWVNEDITQDHFPIKGSGQEEKEVVLFHFDKVMTSEQAITDMDKAGFRPVLIEEFLALGAQQPELQKKFPIICLDSVWRSSHGDRYVPCLDCDGARRDLHLYGLGLAWVVDYRFVAVRK